MHGLRTIKAMNRQQQEVLGNVKREAQALRARFWAVMAIIASATILAFTMV